MEVETHRPQPVAAKIADRQRDRPGIHRTDAARIGAIDLAADHHAHDIVVRRLGDRPGGDHRAVTQHRDAIAEPHHFVQPVRHIEDGAPGFPDFPQDSKQALAFLAGQRGGRLVHHIDARLGPGGFQKGGGDADQHPIADAEACHLAARIDVVDAEAGERGSRSRRQALPVDQAARSLRVCAAEKDVFGDRQRRHDVQFLMDEAQAVGEGGARAVDDDAPSVDGDLRPVRAGDARQDVDQRRLARAVLADKSMDFAGRKLERNAAQGRHAGIGLGDVAEGEETHCPT